ncbi:NfeD family protein [Kamptonema sp. UHCC 0994]|uniref:NfeD family protein n=1 Tax=Kamptonema sp. UHCC 0994 TaxID=3031329 RepID=UPI0023B94032|nr:NfeD family protein [Kamptonema sp. UHCC 0994]MDF0554051.1 NfeD family protein [Kamptonema sp. UHCC 0994]
MPQAIEFLGELGMFFSNDKPELFSEAIEGVVEETISSVQPGRVRCLGTYWPAQLYKVECQVTLIPEQAVCIVGRVGITLLVMPR